MELANAIEPVQDGRIYIEAFVSPNSFPVLRLMKCSFMQAEQIMPLNSFSGASSSSPNQCWTFSLVVGRVKTKAPMPSPSMFKNLGARGGRGPVCLGGRASQPERPGRQAARYVSTLWSCDEPGLIWRKKWAAETHATVRRPATPNAPARAAGVVAIESIVFRKYDRAIHTTDRVNTDAQHDGRQRLAPHLRRSPARRR